MNIPKAALDKKDRKLYLEFLRIAAILAVIFNHAPGFGLPLGNSSCALEFLNNVSMELCKMAVPLFFMISGALLLERKEPWHIFFRKRISRYIIVLISYGLLQYCYALYEMRGEMQWSWRLVIQNIYSGWPLNLHSASYPSAVWFLYAYLAMMLFLPIMRTLVRAMSADHYIYLFALQILLLGVLPMCAGILYTTGVSGTTRICAYFPFVLGGIYALYMLLGHFCENVLPHMHEKRKIERMLLWATPLCLFLGAAGMYLYPDARSMGMPNEMQQTGFMASFLLLPCACIYLLTKRCLSKISQESICGRTLCCLGGGVFTVMLTENIFRANLMSLYEIIEPHTGMHFGSCVLTMATFCPAVLLGCLLKQLPIIRNYI